MGALEETVSDAVLGGWVRVDDGSESGAVVPLYVRREHRELFWREAVKDKPLVVSIPPRMRFVKPV